MRKTPTYDDRCGTNAGHAAHLYRDEEPCRPCKDAHNSYMEAYRRQRGVKAQPPLQPCGTEAGYSRHRRKDEVACAPCLQAHNLGGQAHQYGISVPIMSALFDEFGGKCWACLMHSATNVDHDHDCCDGARSCGACVRGVLCWRCNVVEGHLKDWPEGSKAVFRTYLDLAPRAQKIIQENRRVP